MPLDRESYTRQLYPPETDFATMHDTLNVNDNCKNTKNPDQIDSDGDGV